MPTTDPDQLIVAAMLAVVEHKLSKGVCNLEEKDQDGETALVKACLGGYGRMVNVLIEAGADVKAKSSTGVSVAELLANHEFVAQRGMLNSISDAAKTKLGYVVDPDLACLSGYNLGMLSESFELAAVTNEVEHVKAFLNYFGQEAFDIKVVTKNAYFGGGNLTFPYLLKETNAFDSSSGSFRFLFEILQNKDKRLFSGLCERDLVDWIWEQYLRHPVCDDGDFSMLDASLEIRLPDLALALIYHEKVDLLAFDKNLKSPLHRCAESKHVKTVEALLEMGVDVESKTGDGETALVLACKKGYLEMVDSLLRLGADIDGPTERGTTPLMWAANCGELKVVEFLLLKGADARRLNDLKMSALHAAIYSDRPQCARLMVESGLEIDFKGPDGQTPLHLAAEDVQLLPMLEYLIEAGADPFIKDDAGDLPLNIALRCQNVKAAALIEARQSEIEKQQISTLLAGDAASESEGKSKKGWI
ncbi:ankyrin repeat domain-containing protein [Rhodoferax aquaticus]|uniref:Ankyrin repeat domain-containing protein n=1 Tax=Rhodoferax aquaticus TaxID=2527691 RepID=A0A515EQP3_9BURK|nr:ankyrin repeat domain-containing protein [Rhodoferax aquaticus]QDL54984.1 hypothetical protein EXZ61_12870 [Rhodoferax aquaticus]